jgi:hypothetical protein
MSSSRALPTPDALADRRAPDAPLILSDAGAAAEAAALEVSRAVDASSVVEKFSIFGGQSR